MHLHCAKYVKFQNVEISENLSIINATFSHFRNLYVKRKVIIAEAKFSIFRECVLGKKFRICGENIEITDCSLVALFLKKNYKQFSSILSLFCPIGVCDIILQFRGRSLPNIRS